MMRPANLRGSRLSPIIVVLVMTLSLILSVTEAPAVADPGCIPLGITGFDGSPAQVAMPPSGSICFTFSGLGHFMPSIGSSDGSWNPSVTYDYDNNVDNHPGENGAASPTFEFNVNAPFQITVSGSPPQGNAGLIDAIVYDLTSTAGCSTDAGDLAWGKAPKQVSFTSAQQVRCVRLDSLHSGEAIQTLHGGSLNTWVVKANGWPADDTRFGNTIRCAVASSSLCWFNEGGPWRMLMKPGGAPGTEEYTVNNFNNTTGCDSRIAGKLSFKDHPAEFTRSALTQDCVLLSAGPNVPLQLEYDGGDNPDWNTSIAMYDGDGRQICGPLQVIPLSASAAKTKTCVTTENGPYRILATGASGNETNLAARRLTNPVGCAAMTSTPVGLEERAFDTTSVADHPCFTFTGATGDVLRMSAIDKALGRHASIDLYNPDGSYLGVTHYYDPDGYKDFSLPQTGTYLGRLTVEAQFPETHTSVSGICQNPLCGGLSLGVATVSPNLVGAANGVTLHVTGAGLTKDTTFTLEQGTDQVVGTPITTGSDGRTAEVRFDLAGRTGSFDLTVSNSFGDAPQTLPNAVLVQSAQAPRVSVSVSARDNYVPDRPQTVSVTLTNSGNTDAFAVPVTIGWLPPDSTIEPKFPLVDPQVNLSTHQVTVQPGTWDGGVTNDAGEVGAAMMLPMLPAGSSKTFSFKVTISDPGGYDLKVGGGSCGAPSQSAQEPEETTDCGEAILSALFGFVPFADCANTARNVFKNTIGLMTGYTKMTEIASTFDVLADGVSCIADLVVPGSSTSEKMSRAALDLMGKGLAANEVYKNCIQTSNTRITPVGSHDPNYLIGPGSGRLHATEARGSQHFELGFENSPYATAPAQEVVATAHLDPAKFDLSTLRFGAVSFGSTTWSPTPGSASIDTVIDPQRDDNLTVGLTAEVNTNTGDVTWHFLSRDPGTLELPEDPAMGFLPPDTDGVVGQGTVGFDVALKEPATGSVTSTASVVFDTNAAMATDPWTFLVDRDNPIATVSTPATTTTGSIPVSFSSSDPTADSGDVSLLVSVDGGAPTLWRDRAPSGTATFAGTPGHQYKFLAQTIDQAGHGSPVVAATSQTVVLANVVAPQVTGKAKVGRKLRANPGTWSIPGVTFSYQWLANGKPIKRKAAQSIFKVARKQRRRTLSVQITASAPGQQPVVLLARVGRIR